MDIGERVGHTLVLGTTRVGKTRLAEILITQDIRRGDVVMLVDGSGKELGRGLAEYSDEEARQLAGCRSEQIEERLGYRGSSVMVHRDDLVLFDHD